MDESNNKLISQLETLLGRASAIVAKLQSVGQPRDASIEAEVAAKIARRECLVCGRISDSSDLYRRGLDTRHYQQALRLMEKGATTEEELMANGHLGPRDMGGRKQDERSALDQYDKKSHAVRLGSDSLKPEAISGAESDDTDAPPAHTPRGETVVTKRKKNQGKKSEAK